MGTWGVALFSDDLAADVRNTFRELIGDGLTATEATRRLIEEFKDSIRDRDEGPVFWLALAVTQWKLGRLESTVLHKALEHLDRGTDLERWADDPEGQHKRKVVLEKLRAQITSAPPSPRKVPKVFKDANPWNVGDVVSYRLLSGALAFFRVLGHHTDKGGRSAVCEVLDWSQGHPPSREDASSLSIKVTLDGGHSQFMLGGPTPRQKGQERLVPLGVRSKPLQAPESYLVFPWAYLDQLLEETYGLK